MNRKELDYLQRLITGLKAVILQDTRLRRAFCQYHDYWQLKTDNMEVEANTVLEFIAGYMIFGRLNIELFGQEAVARHEITQRTEAFIETIRRCTA